MIALWDRFWFRRSDRYQYGIFRMLLVGGLFGIHWEEWTLTDFRAAMSAPPELTAPVGLATWLHLPLYPPATWVAPLSHVFHLLVILAFVGLATRVTLVSLALLNLYVQTVVNSFGFIDHATTLPSLVLLVMAFAPGVTRFSVDALIGRLARRTPRRGPVPVWPAQLILVLMALSYCTSGLSKLRESSWHWGDGTTLAAYLGDPADNDFLLAPMPGRPAAAWRGEGALESFIYSTGRPTAVGRWVARHRVVVATMSTMTVLWELTFPLVLLFPATRPAYFAGGIGFHVGIMATMHLVSFYSFLVCYLLFVDWRWLGVAVAPTARESSAAG
jgi:hypothetical protein